MTGKELGYTFARIVAVSGDQPVTTASPSYSKTNFVYNFGTNTQKVARVSFVSITFPNNAYNVNDNGGGQNNLFSFTVGAVESDLSVEGGFYTTTTLTNAVETAVQAILTSNGTGQTFTLTQDTLTQKVIATYGAGTSGNATLTIERTNGQSGVWDILGFNVSSPEILTTAVPRVADNLPSLGGLKEAFLKSDQLAPGNLFDNKGAQKNVCLAIPITAPFGVSNVFECKVDSLCEITYPTPRNLQQVDFSLVDRNGNTIDLHGGNLTINLKIWFYRF